MKEYFELFAAFFRIGLFTFGGGYAMIPMLEREIVEKHGWADNEELMDYYAVGQCTPGIIAVNTGTFVGYKRKGKLGGIAATLGVVAPSLIIITLIAALISSFAELPAVKSAFAGIRVCVCVLIFNSVLKLWKSAVKDRYALILFAAVFFLSIFFDISPVIFVIVCGFAGVILTNMGVRGK